MDIVEPSVVGTELVWMTQPRAHAADMVTKRNDGAQAPPFMISLSFLTLAIHAPVLSTAS